jgi:hypothetical protein
VEQGKLSDAEAIELLEGHLRKGSIDVLIPLADLYEKVGRWADAEGALRWSLESGEPNALHNLALFLWEDGRQQEGLDLWTRAADAGDAMATSALQRRDVARYQRREARSARHLAPTRQQAREAVLLSLGAVAGAALASLLARGRKIA